MNGELERNRKRFRARPESTFIRLEVKGPSMAKRERDFALQGLYNEQAH